MRSVSPIFYPSHSITCRMGRVCVCVCVWLCVCGCWCVSVVVSVCNTNNVRKIGGGTTECHLRSTEMQCETYCTLAIHLLCRLYANLSIVYHCLLHTHTHPLKPSYVCVYVFKKLICLLLICGLFLLLLLLYCFAQLIPTAYKYFYG